MLSLNHLEQALSNITGLAKGVLNYQFIYNELEPYYLDNYLGISNKNNLVSIKFSGDENNLKLLLKELKLGFGIQDEMVLDLDLTNFRLWDKICEQELHDLILSQYVVDDSHNTLIVDNAQQELLLHYKWS